MHLRALTTNDELPLSVLLDSTFGGPDMYRFAQALRDEQAMAMERVACDETGAMIGYVCCARMVAPEDWWVLSILAVSPSHHKRGMGRELVVRGMDCARREGAKAVIVIGDARYFSRVGFSKLAASHLETTMMPEHTLLYPIAPGTGMAHETLIYPDAYAHLSEDDLV
ncbi:putative acetyltransferase [Celeribacter persicus]|uniref:Putative acetyltransferase n=1 Tax=Celeribacter persicus TaxID=1651082 RepID=A0A2T5H7F4_9RHOB|nr:putative acetyltransferase [Celeribacter persicus]